MTVRWDDRPETETEPPRIRPPAYSVAVPDVERILTRQMFETQLAELQHRVDAAEAEAQKYRMMALVTAGQTLQAAGPPDPMRSRTPLVTHDVAKDQPLSDGPIWLITAAGSTVRVRGKTAMHALNIVPFPFLLNATAVTVQRV